MSACSDFVEHIWKPGSCQNCFCPRHFHQLQTPPLDLGNSGGLAQDKRGIRAKAEPLEDDGVTPLQYSKPTIAVKPTMINSDISEAWSDGNPSADIPQVNRRTAPGKHVFVKSGEEQKAYTDSFSNHILRKPFSQKPSSDCVSHGPCGPSLVGTSAPANKAERNRTFLGESDVQEEGTKVPGKEKLPYLGLYHKPSIFSDRHVNSAMDSVGYPSVCQRGEAFSLEKAGVSNSPDLENEGGEYCSIVDCCRESLVHRTLGSTDAKPAWPESKNHVLKQGGAVNTETKSRAVNVGEEESGALDYSSDFPRDKHPHDAIYSRLHSETEMLAFPTGNNSPVGLCQGTYCCPLDGASDQIEDEDTENVNATAGQPPACRVGLVQNEPIYAESTKRKKVPLGNSNAHLISNVLACSPSEDQTEGHWRERVHHSERDFHDSATQIAATITIMAAHTENDNRTIFLSSPDSAVGFQWPCVSPTSHPETGKTSSFFEHVEGPQESSEVVLRGNGPGLQAQMASKNMVGKGPAIPPKLSKGSPPRNVGSVAQPVTSPGARTSDNGGHEEVDVAKNGADATVVGPSCSLHVNSISLEDANRGLSSSSSERRHKYYNLSWSRQCRIEEEEEEEQGLSKNTEETEAENGLDGPSSHQEWRNCSGQENKTGGMCKSASFAFEFPKDKNGIDDFAPPPPPPKKQFRHFLKMNKSNSDLEKLGGDSAESHSPPFQAVHLTFTAGSTDSLHLDTISNGGQSCKASLRSPTRTGKHIFPPAHVPACSGQDRPHCTPLQPPPLPQKKTVSRAVSSPDGFYWGPASPARAAIPRSPKLNFSQSESNVCIREESLFGSNLGMTHRTFSSSESLEKAFKASRSLFPLSGKNGNVCCTQDRNLPPRSFSQHNMSARAPSGSRLQLHNLLSNIDNKEGVYAKLGGLYAESLRRLVAKCEDCFMREQKSELHFNENSWSLFKLTCNKPCCDSGDAIYYCATCAKDPTSTYAVKICKTQDTKMATSSCSPSVPVHFNIQQDCGHFVASVPSSMLKNASEDSQGPSRATPEQDCVVVITREVPHQTAADFVQNAVAFHQAKPELYERRVCFLLLQLCNGLEHLKEYSVIHRDLCLENLLLARCKPSPGCSRTKEDMSLPRLIISNFLKAKQKSGPAESKVKRNQARLAPEIVSASQYKKFDEFQTGILIYELLHQPNPFEVKARLREEEYGPDDLPPLPYLSIYSPGLQQLAHLLLEADPIKRIRITEAKRVLQCLLWGPRKDLTEQPLDHPEALHDALHNWVDMKRALLMMKFAERAVDAERSIELEDWLCCQYLASADPFSLSKSLKLLQLL
uniref:inactive tyrosine-protein kinase PRAG1 n=1 Tax=Euleptes europaea TaxID=460621 RepID=UPI0025419439|nr:inactive tyrosine-protein kinase PRAG1 [Euleptes europaea]